MCIRDRDEAYFHAQFRRSNPTQGSLHTLIDGVKGKGQYVGTYPVSYTHLDVYKRQDCCGFPGTAPVDGL